MDCLAPLALAAIMWCGDHRALAAERQEGGLPDAAAAAEAEMY